MQRRTVESVAMSTSDASNDESGGLRPGMRVEVRNAFEGTWSRGFTIIAIEDGRIRLQRRSDHTELPATFAPADVREEHRRSMWWV